MKIKKVINFILCSIACFARGIFPFFDCVYLLVFDLLAKAY